MLRGRDALKPPTPPPRAVRVSMAEPSRSDQSRAWNSREYNSKQTESEPKGASWLKARGRDDDRRRPDIGGRTYGTVPSTYTRQERIRPGYGHVPSQDSADAVWGSATSQLRNDGVEGSMEVEYTMMMPEGIHRFRPHPVRQGRVSNATLFADVEDGSSEPLEEDFQQAVVERDAANRRVENLTSEVVRLASLVKALKTENPAKENASSNIYSSTDANVNGGSWAMSQDAQRTMFSDFFGNTTLKGFDGMADSSSPSTTWSRGRSTKQLFSTVVSVFRRRRSAWWRGIAFRCWLEIVRWRSRVASVRGVLLSRHKRSTLLRSIHEWARIVRRELHLEKSMGKWLERTLAQAFGWWRHIKNGPYVRASDGLRAPGNLVPRPFLAFQRWGPGMEQGTEYDDPRHQVLIMQMRARWRRKNRYTWIHQWRHNVVQERSFQQSERIVRKRRRAGLAHSSLLHWRDKLLERRMQYRGERACERLWARRLREAFMRLKAGYRTALRAEPPLPLPIVSPGRAMSPLAMSPSEKKAMEMEATGRAAALEAALQRTEAERHAAVSRIQMLEAQLSEQRLRADQAVLAMNQARREERRMAGEAARSLEVMATSPMSSPNLSLVEDEGTTTEQFKERIMQLLESQAMDIQQLEHSCKRSAMEQSWRTALQSGLREVVELSEEVWDTAKGNEEAVRRAKDKTNAAIVESCAALDEVEAAVELLARAPRFPSPSRADLARAELTRSRSNSPVKTPRTPGRPAVNDSFGEVWECLADVLDRVPIHFPGLIGQLIREHLEDMLGAMSLIKKQTWGKADKTLGRLQVNTRLLHVEITRQAASSPKSPRPKAAHVVVV